MRATLPKLPRRFDAIEFRHRQIHQDQIRICSICLSAPFLAISGLDDLVTFGPQPGRQEHSIIGIVIDDKNGGRRIDHGSNPSIV
jgi:hypothetical protein